MVSLQWVTTKLASWRLSVFSIYLNLSPFVGCQSILSPTPLVLPLRPTMAFSANTIVCVSTFVTSLGKQPKENMSWKIGFDGTAVKLQSPICLNLHYAPRLWNPIGSFPACLGVVGCVLPVSGGGGGVVSGGGGGVVSGEGGGVVSGGGGGVVSGDGALQNLVWALKSKRSQIFIIVWKLHLCMGEEFCVQFWRHPLKFHRKYLAHILKDAYFIIRWKF